MTITEECFQRGIYTHVGIFTQKSPSFYREQSPRSFCASLKLRSEVSATRSGDISRRAARFRFRRHERRRKKKGKKQAEGQTIFSTRKGNMGNAAGTVGWKGLSLSLALSSLRASCETHTNRHRRWSARAKCIEYTSARVHPRDTHVRTSEAWHTHVRDECVLEMRALFPRKLRVDERGKGGGRAKKRVKRPIKGRREKERNGKEVRASV